LNIADYIAIILVAVLVIAGIKRGFVRSVFTLGSLILSLILSLTLYPVVSDFMAESVLGDYVRLNVYKALDAEEEPETVEEAGETLNLPESIRSSIQNVTNDAVSSVKESIAESTVTIALKLVGILLVFLLVRILLWVIQKLLDIVSHLPVLRSANKFLGGLIGMVYGVMLVYIILAVFTFTTTLQAMNKPTQLILESKYVSNMYHQNIILDFMK